MTTGPLQLVVLGFDQLDRFRGQILAELQEVRGRDLIRLLDLLFVAKDERGELTALDLSDLPEEERASYGSLLGTLVDLDLASDGPAPDDTMPEGSEAGLSLEGARQVAQMLEPGSAAALLLVEHRWAARLAAAVRDAGGRLLAQGFLTPDARVMMGEALSGVAEAEAALEIAEAMRGAALLDALTAVAEVEVVEEAAAQAVIEAAAAEDRGLRSAAAADVVRALVVAGVLEDTAALDAIEALVAAGLIDRAMVEAALEGEPATVAIGQSTDGDDGR
jgi:uncharacterized membrane protein